MMEPIRGSRGSPTPSNADRLIASRRKARPRWPTAHDTHTGDEHHGDHQKRQSRLSDQHIDASQGSTTPERVQPPVNEPAQSQGAQSPANRSVDSTRMDVDAENPAPRDRRQPRVKGISGFRHAFRSAQPPARSWMKQAHKRTHPRVFPPDEPTRHSFAPWEIAQPCPISRCWDALSRTRNRSDSGSQQYRQSDNKAAHHRHKHGFHPNAGTSHDAITPPIAAPAVNPFATINMMLTRERRGLYSPTSATALGMIPPRPMPARKRTASSESSVVICVVKTVRTEK